jgi:O-antigen/teichoic acid export membrane protein
VLTQLKQFWKTPRRSARSWLAVLSASPFLRKAALLSGGSAAGHLFTLAVAPLLTRLYRPQDFASLGLFSCYLSVAGVGVALQYESGIVSAADTAEAAYLVLSAAFIGIPASVLAGLGLGLLIHNSVLGFGILPRYSPIALSSVMCFVGYFVVLRYWNLRAQNFRNVSKAIVAQSAARAGFQVACGFLGFQGAGLIIGETLGRGVGMGRMLKSARPDLYPYVVGFRWRDCKQALGKNWKFPLLSLPSSLIDALCVSLALPLLIHAYGAQSGGCYALVWRVLALPSVLIIQAVADSFHSHFAICVRESPAGVLDYFRRTSMNLLLAGSVPCVVLLLWGRPLFTLIFGAQWEAAGTMAALVAPWYLGQFVVNPLSRVVFVLNGQETKLIWDMVCLVALPGVFYVAHQRQLNVQHAVMLLSIVNALLHGAYFAVLLRILLNHHRGIATSAQVTVVPEEVAP